MAFHTTHWTMVLAASAEGTLAHEALSSLCSTYWYPLYAFIRRQGATPHEAEDLTQEFFCRILKRDWLANVQPAAGKFRSFLLTCLKNFLSNEWERASAQRRGGGRKPIPFDSRSAETWYSLEPADPVTPEILFERRWAFTLLDRTMSKLRQEYSRIEKLDAFEELQGFLPGGQGNTSRAELAAKRGVSAGAIPIPLSSPRGSWSRRWRDRARARRRGRAAP